jgi:hypothetical protein
VRENCTWEEFVGWEIRDASVGTLLTKQRIRGLVLFC